MMILISGQPGNGKTLRALALMVEEHDRNLEAVKAGKEQPRAFYANIAGIKFDWVQPIPATDHVMPDGRIVPAPDWRLCPDGSYVVYDEAHADGKTEGLERYGLLFPTTGKPGEADDPRVKAMSTHRHRGFDLVFVTQWPNKVHHTLRTLVGRHIHMNRALGLQRAGVFTWSRVQADPYDEKAREKAEEEIWAFPQDLYSQYESSTLHTVTYKFKVPRKVWGALSMLVMMGVVCWLLWAFVFKPTAKADDSETQNVAASANAPLGAGGPPVTSDKERYESPEDYARAFIPRIPTVPWSAPAFDDREVLSDPEVFCSIAHAGVDANGEFREQSCHCLTEQGTRYRMQQKTCELLAVEGRPYNPYKAPHRDDRGEGVSPSVMAAPAAAPSPVGVGDVATVQAPYGTFRSEPVTVPRADGF